MTNKNIDLLVLALVTIAAIAFINVPALQENLVRTALGLLLTLFVPGYALVAALFTKKNDLKDIERLALSFGLSIAVVPLIGLVLNYTPYGIQKDAILAGVSAFALICLLIAFLRRSKAGEEAYVLEINSVGINLKGLDGALTILLLIAIIASVAVLIYVIVSPKQGEKFTEFYILGPGGKADDYPTSLKQGDNGTVIIGVVNHEYQGMEYALSAVYGGKTIDERIINLGHNATYESSLIFTAVGNSTEKLEFLLYRKDNSSMPYRSLHLWVKSSEEPPKKNITVVKNETMPKENKTIVNTTKPVVPKIAPIIIYSIGDSVTSGAGGTFGHRTSLEPKASKGKNKNHTYQYWLDKYMGTNASAENANLTYYNKGISAQTCSQVLSRFNNDVGNNADVIVGCGIKDALTGAKPKEVESDLEKIYNLSIAKNLSLKLVSILPYEKGKYCSFVLEVNSWMKNFTGARSIKYVDAHREFSNGTDCAVNASLYESDSVNLNVDGQAELAKQIWVQAYNSTVYKK